MALHNGINDGRTVMRAALRVLAAASYKGRTRPEDLELLRHYAPDLAHKALDDFAREVVGRIARTRADFLQPKAS